MSHTIIRRPAQDKAARSESIQQALDLWKEKYIQWFGEDDLYNKFVKGVWAEPKYPVPPQLMNWYQMTIKELK